MPNITVLEKAYGSFSPKKFESTIQSLCEGLKIRLRFVEVTGEGWVKIEVEGEDEKVALRYLDEKIGLAPMDRIERFSVCRGFVVEGKEKMELLVDIGVYSPEPFYVAVPLRHLQAQLVDGKKLALQQIKTLFCLVENFPLKIKVMDFQNGHGMGELFEGQLQCFADWISSCLDRLIVFGAFSDEVEKAVRISGCFRDVVEVEALGLLECAVVCKLGTDAVGLIPKIGRVLSKATFAPFSPRKILNLLEGHS